MLASPDRSEQDKWYAGNRLKLLDATLNGDIEAKLSPFVTYYDLNPDKFKDMSTAVFMQKAKDYDRLSKYIDATETRLVRADEMADEWDTMLEQGTCRTECLLPLGTLKLADKILRFYSAMDERATTLHEYAKERGLEISDEDPGSNWNKMREFIRNQVRETITGAFDKAPRSIIEHQLQIIKEHRELAQKILEEHKAERQALEDEAKSNGEAESSSEN